MYDVLYVLIGIGLVKILDFILNLKREKNKNNKNLIEQLQDQMETMNKRVQTLENRIDKQSKLISQLEKENGILETENTHLNKEIDILKGEV